MENLGFKPTAALGGETEKADEVGVKGGHPSGADDLQGSCRDGRGAGRLYSQEPSLAESTPETGSQDFCFHSDSVTLSKSFPSALGFSFLIRKVATASLPLRPWGSGDVH